MTYKIMVAAVITAVVVSPVTAQSITGASLSTEYRQYVDEDYDPGLFSLDAGADITLGRSFLFGGNVSFYQESFFFEETTLNTTLHGAYKATPNFAFGVFVGQDTNDTLDSTNFGIEIGGVSTAASYELYYGATDTNAFSSSDDDIDMFGFGVEFDVGRNISLGMTYDSFYVPEGVYNIDTEELETLTYYDFGVSVRYTLAAGASFYAELGQVSVSTETGTAFVDDPDPVEYIGIGAEYTFGGAGRNIFSDRTLVGFGG